MIKKILLYINILFLLCVSGITQAATAVVIDTDLNDKRFANTQDIQDGIAPVLILLDSDKPRAIQTTDELLSLDSNHSGMVDASDKEFYQLAVAYFPAKQSLFTRIKLFFGGRWFSHTFLSETSFERDKKKISIFPFKNVGIRGVVLDTKLAREENIAHPNFKGAAGFAVMSDNSKRPIAVIELPAEIITDIQDPSKYLLVQ